MKNMTSTPQVPTGGPTQALSFPNITIVLTSIFLDWFSCFLFSINGTFCESSFVPGSFWSLWYLWDSSILLQVAVTYSFSLLYKYSMFSYHLYILPRSPKNKPGANIPKLFLNFPWFSPSEKCPHDVGHLASYKNCLDGHVMQAKKNLSPAVKMTRHVKVKNGKMGSQHSGEISWRWKRRPAC